jgi:hypothetical protein
VRRSGWPDAKHGRTANEDPGGAISSALGQYNGATRLKRRPWALVAIASALNQLARVVENLWKA